MQPSTCRCHHSKRSADLLCRSAVLRLDPAGAGLVSYYIMAICIVNNKMSSVVGQFAVVPAISHQGCPNSPTIRALSAALPPAGASLIWTSLLINRGWRIRPDGFCRDVCDPQFVDVITAICPWPRSKRHSRNGTSNSTTASRPGA